MRFSIIKTIFQKELKEVLRDRRMIYLIILLPFFLYPALFYLIGKVGQNQQKQMSEESVQVLLNLDAEQTAVYEIVKNTAGFDLSLRNFDQSELDALKNTIGIQVTADYNQQIAQNGTAQIEIFANQSNDLLKKRQNLIIQQLETINQQILLQRLDSAGLEQSFIQPLNIKKTDLASTKVRLGKAIGSYLPMMLLLFIFMGAIYIAIDITAGEKERRTLQTLFTTPSRVGEIIAGKFLAVLAVALTSAFMNLSSLVVAILLQAKLMGGNISKFAIDVSPTGWVWLILLIVLSAILLAAMSLAVVLLANSYKEAQSYVSPLMMLVLIPAILVQMPGMELNMTTACIPILNICLAMGAIFKGTFSIGAMALTVVFLAVYSAIALYFASLVFKNENVITGEKVNFKQLFAN